MKMIIVVALALAAVAVAAPAVGAPAVGAPAVGAPPELIKILRSEFDQQPDGGYVYNFETENGIQQQETGELKEAVDEENKPHKVVVVRGSYSYTNPEGKVETINYFADETGYHPEGDSIPKAPVAARR